MPTYGYMVTFSLNILLSMNNAYPFFFRLVGCNARTKGYSERAWPITGGSWGKGACAYAEVLITGHADGSVRFWDASSLSLQVSGVTQIQMMAHSFEKGYFEQTAKNYCGCDIYR